MNGPKDWSPADDTEKKALAVWTRAHETLLALNDELKAKYPEIGLSFGYIGNDDIRYDDRSWMFFTQVLSEGQWGYTRMHFGGYRTADLPKFAKEALDPARGLENWIKTRALPRLKQEHGGTMSGPKDWEPAPLPLVDPRVKALRDRIRRAINEADTAFWAEIVKEFPEVKSGDFGPDDTFRWEGAAEAAVLSWLGYNYPESYLIKPIIFHHTYRGTL